MNIRLLNYMRPAGAGLAIASLFWGAPAWSLESTDCVLTPHTVTDVGSSAAGIIDKLFADRGDRVEAGQVIASLNSEVEQATVDLLVAKSNMDAAIKAAKARVKYQQAQLDRTRKLYQGQHVSSQKVEEAETEFSLARFKLDETREGMKIAQLELARAKAVLDTRNIVSPFDGVVLDRYRQPGEYLAEDRIFRLARIDSLKVEVVLPATSYRSIHVGMVAEIEVDIPERQHAEASVTVVDPVIDAASSTYGVRLELPNPDGAIPAGLRCRVRFPIN